MYNNKGQFIILFDLDTYEIILLHIIDVSHMCSNEKYYRLNIVNSLLILKIYNLKF